jgi:hypothetical protein
LYRKSELNIDNKKKGYFEENGRIRCVKFRGHKSEGLYMPLKSIDFIIPLVNNNDIITSFATKLNFSNSEGLIGLEFDELLGIPICNKYIIKQQRTPGTPGTKKNRTKKWKSKLIDNQFRFHQDTSMLYKNLHRINPNSLISITYKLHGTSGISSYILCKRHISIREKIGSFFHNVYTNITTLGKQKFVLETTEYDYIYSSRKVIKNEELNSNAQHYYNEDIWGIANKELESFLQKGMTLYYEIVGFLPNGGAIQKDYDYGCESNKHTIYIYRITQTNVDGKVFEFSAKQVQDWCKKNGLNPVPELYYGTAENLYWQLNKKYKLFDNSFPENWQERFLDLIKTEYNEKDCYMCSNKVPEEGCVVRIEGLDFEAYKAKSNRFYERETKFLDKGESNIEDEN